MIDYVAERGWLSITLQMQLLMQSVIQARWFDESDFLTLPHVNCNNLHLFYNNILNNYEHLNLPALKDLCRKDYEKLAEPLRELFEEANIEQIYKVIQDLPEISVTVSVQGPLYEETDVLRKVTWAKGKTDNWLPIHPNEVNQFTLV